MKFHVTLLLALSLVLSSCQSTSTHRAPASKESEKMLSSYYSKKAEIGRISDQIQNAQIKKNVYRPDLEVLTSEQSDPVSKLIQQRSKLQAEVNREYEIVSSEMDSDVPVGVKIPFTDHWRRHHDEFILHDLKPYSLQNGQTVKKMFVSTDTTNAFYLQLTNLVFSWKGTNRIDHDPMDRSQLHLNARLNCSHDAVIHGLPTSLKVKAGQWAKFRWYDKKLNGQRATIELKDPRSACELRFSNPTQNIEAGINLIPETEELARIGSPQLESEICYLPQTSHLGPMDQFFLDARVPYMTCPVKIDDVETLEESHEGINAKIRILTGQNLTPEYMNGGNPFLPLDFSKAPKLDAILISYLVFRADFGGNVILQALRYHAQRGALIRIALSDVITLGKDRQMLLDFQDEFPNVKLLFYRYKPQGKGFKDWLSSFHRSNHIKLFLTYSKSDARANKVILGGRNIHDGFVFEQPSANYVYPTMVEYSPDGDEAWARWEDFETLFTSTELVKSIMGQFFSVLHADYLTVHVRSYVEPVQTKKVLDPKYLNLKEDEVLLRSLVSIPFKDNQLLEKTFIKMIDSAQKSIKVSTPYFNLTDGLLQAFRRAADRGVEVELITRLDLKGDTADIILSDVNKKSINKLIDKIKVYEYKPAGKILHSKLFLIDGKFVMMGSVNLNLRSFFHDIENATLVYGPGFNRKIDKLYSQYKSDSQLLTAKQKTVFWKQILISIIGDAL